MFKARKLIAPHPGEVLQMLLMENDITQTKLAGHLGIAQTKVSELCRKRRGVSAEMALKLEKVLSVSANIWMNLQKNWELSQVDRSKIAKVQPLRTTQNNVSHSRRRKAA